MDVVSPPVQKVKVALELFKGRLQSVSWQLDKLVALSFMLTVEVFLKRSST